MPEVVKFEINTPVEVTLRDDQGKRVEGRYGDQVMYSLIDNRIMYVPPYVEQRFQELAIAAGEPLLLCKREVKDGSRNRIEWSVRRAPEQPQAASNGATAADAHGPVIETAVQSVDQKSQNGAAKKEEQSSVTSTAPMAQELALETNHQHQTQDSAAGQGAELVVPVPRQTPLSTKDSIFLPAMTMEVALARRAAIVEFTRRIMVKDQDFGEIPGASKPTLLKPGAEKLCNFFGLEPEFTPIVEDLDWTGTQHSGEVFCYARYRCRLLREGRVVGVGEGSCNSWEAKYRYRWVAEDQVPEHLDRMNLPQRGARRTLYEFDFAMERGETTGPYAKPAEHWQLFREAIAAGTARPVEKLTRRGMSAAWEIDVDTTLYRIPNPDVADVVNTIQKMAQKRALVAATLIATSASEFFTQDVEDLEPCGRETDAGSHRTGNTETKDSARDRKREGDPLKPATSGESAAAVKPWKNFGEMRRLFDQIRERVGETRYLEELALAGVQNPAQFKTGNTALACYVRLTDIAAQPEVF